MGGPVTEQQRPVGDPLVAYRRALARAHRAEAEVRRLRQLLAQEEQER